MSDTIPDLLPPITCSEHVPRLAEMAFAVFTQEIGSWFPRGDFAVHGNHAELSLDENRLVERTAAGAFEVWGQVLAYDAPHHLRMTWSVGPEHPATELDVTFVEEGMGTLVRLVHDGWGQQDTEIRQRYAQAWPTILAAFVEHTTRY
jgi:uncharacterized protein YndB with AHSA1/START domain